jgi:hypothetical protein
VSYIVDRGVRVRSGKPPQREEAHDVADLQTVMRLINVLLEEVSTAVSRQHRALIPNALLNLAAERMLAEDRPESVAAILYRLADLIAQGRRPEGRDAFPLSS